jgi:hypothetical protein
MQQMSEAIKAFSKTMDTTSDPELVPATPLPPEAEMMRAAAGQWAVVCLGEFRDKLLTKGLAVSAAVADFLAELESSLHDKLVRVLGEVPGASSVRRPRPDGAMRGMPQRGG